MNVAGKHFWLIGASEGIGQATAQRLAECGAIVTVSARSEEALRELVANLPGEGHRAVTCDVTDLSSLQRAYAALKPVDAVIYNAGIYEPMPWQAWNLESAIKTMDVNVMGVFRVLEVLREAIDASALQRLVLLGSVAGYRGLPKAMAYGASKAAVNHLAEILRLELEQKRVTVQLVCPGFVKTRLTDKNDFAMPFRISTEEAAQRIVQGIESDRFEIHFPRRFTYLMKALAMLPRCISHALLRRM